ncbi:MAG: type I DNA topoisomerase, partial [Myxococcota bacterium]
EKTVAKKAKAAPAARKSRASDDGETKKAAPKAAKTPAVAADGDGEAVKHNGRGLVVVESPAKAKTIKKYLGNNFTVRASVGHIKDLPKRSIGVDPDKDFEVEYDVISGKKDVVRELRSAAEGVETIYLAPDPDREGEAIAWHIKEELEDINTNIVRVRFNEITPKAVREAIAHPQALDVKRYESQQARRILDRLVGYQISPILWKKVRRGLSAGRVQSVAVRIIVERERAIAAFKPEEYWTLDAEVEKPGHPPKFVAHTIREKGQKLEIPNGEVATRIHDALQKADFVVEKVDKKERQRRAPAPFVTSKLQQDSANRLHYSAKRTMQIAQGLYEGVELGEDGSVGLITYMRTDSTRVSDDALTAVRGFVESTYGKQYLPETPNVFKTKKNAQDAHEAIRPTNLKYTPESVEKYLDKDQFRLYKLIFDRFVASQMMPARYDQTAVDIAAGDFTLRATGSVLKFAGFLAAYGEVADEDQSARDKREEREDEERELPELNAGDKLNLSKLLKEQHFTQPPPRFTEASLVKELEENGIGRPSTYASILSTIVDKEYVTKDQGRFRPTELGTIVTDLLIENFPDIMDVHFTADMEGKLDAVEEGEQNWKGLLHEFYAPFKKSLELAAHEMRDVKRQEVETDHVCEKCGGKMVIKWGKLGSFLACKNYPECKNTKDIKRDAEGGVTVVQVESAGEKCPKCGSDMVIKNGRFGRFIACSRYPECKTTKPVSTGVPCPECKQGQVAEKRSRKGKVFYGCNRWPDCNFVLWDKPVAQPCPNCAKPYLVEKVLKSGRQLRCSDRECGYMRELSDEATGDGAVAG